MDYQTIFDEARKAGLEAGNNHKPTPMVVGQAKSLFSSEIDYNKPTEIVHQGVCGFAEIIVKNGRTGFAKWLKKNQGCRKHYYGGIYYWVSDFGQSMEKKEVFAKAFAKVLKSYDIDCYSTSRMD